MLPNFLPNNVPFELRSEGKVGVSQVRKGRKNATSFRKQNVEKLCGQRVYGLWKGLRTSSVAGEKLGLHLGGTQSPLGHVKSYLL